MGCTEEETRAQAATEDYTGALKRDNDVLDTWFSSALMLSSPLSWPADTSELKYPPLSAVLAAGYDTIFFWVTRIVTMAPHLIGEVSSHTVYVHGLVRDSEGKKMSKFEDNTLDSVDLTDGIALEPLLAECTTGLCCPKDTPKIEKCTRKEFPDGTPAFDADALRFTFASLVTLGRSINFDLGRCEGYHSFCNEPWSAMRFAPMNTEGQGCDVQEYVGDCGPEDYLDFSQADRRIVPLLRRVETEMEEGSADYRFDNIASAIYRFVWDEYCDWHLELAKVQTQTGTLTQQRATRCTLLCVLETMLRLVYPIISFTTEELWQKIASTVGRAKDDGTENPVLQEYSRTVLTETGEQAEQQVQQLKVLADVCRNLHGEMNISSAQHAPLHVSGEVESPQMTVLYVQALSKLSKVKVYTDVATTEQDDAGAPVAIVGENKSLLKIEIDVTAEHAYLLKEIDRLRGEITKREVKLDNELFAARVPVAMVEQEQKRMAGFKATLARLEVQIARLPIQAA